MIVKVIKAMSLSEGRDEISNLPMDLYEEGDEAVVLLPNGLEFIFVLKPPWGLVQPFVSDYVIKPSRKDIK